MGKGKKGCTGERVRNWVPSGSFEYIKSGRAGWVKIVEDISPIQPFRFLCSYFITKLLCFLYVQQLHLKHENGTSRDWALLVHAVTKILRNV